jgi:hypothetical protein
MIIIIYYIYIKLKYIFHKCISIYLKFYKKKKQKRKRKNKPTKKKENKKGKDVLLRNHIHYTTCCGPYHPWTEICPPL